MNHKIKRMLLICLIPLMSQIANAYWDDMIKLQNNSQTLLFSVVRDNVEHGWVGNPQEGYYWENDANYGKIFFINRGKKDVSYGFEGQFIVEVKNKATGALKGHCRFYSWVRDTKKTNWECSTRIDVTAGVDTEHKNSILVKFSEQP